MHETLNAGTVVVIATVLNGRRSASGTPAEIASMEARGNRGGGFVYGALPGRRDAEGGEVVAGVGGGRSEKRAGPGIHFF